MENIQEFINNHVVLYHKKRGVTIYLDDILEYNFYNDIEEFINDNSYLLKENEQANDILSNPIVFDDFISFLQSENNIHFNNRKESIMCVRAKNNDDADYHITLTKNIKEKDILNFLLAPINESHDIESYQLVRY